MNRFFRSSTPFHLSPGRLLGSYLFLVIWTLVVLFPLFWLVTTAFKSPADVDQGPKFLPFVDYKPTLDAWNYLLADPTSGNIVARPYLNTVVVGTTSASLALLLGATAAYALMRFQYQVKVGYIFSAILCLLIFIGLLAAGVSGLLSLIIAVVTYIIITQTVGRRFRRSMKNNDIAFWLISQRMLPPVAVIIPIYIMFQQLRMLDNLITLIISYCAINFPLGVWFMRDYLENIPIELEESAFIDGASRYQVLSRIVLPLAWNEYTLALFLSGAKSQTMPLLVTAQNATRGPQWWNISILVLLMIAPLIVAAIALERFIARGLLVGAVKS
jgi:multiple sugar transport system permease protein